VKKLTPILFVQAIEPVLSFWTERLGFELTVQVPEGEKLGFVTLRRGPVEIMYQTRDSMKNDIPGVADSPMQGSFLFVEVEDLDEVERGLEGVKPVVPRRKTFYGSDELIVREPAGNVVTFAFFE
jgi:uncharacterized glyoxalase superfamily protein PhnB